MASNQLQLNVNNKCLFFAILLVSITSISVHLIGVHDFKLTHKSLNIIDNNHINPTENTNYIPFIPFIPLNHTYFDLKPLNPAHILQNWNKFSCVSVKYKTLNELYDNKINLSNILNRECLWSVARDISINWDEIMNKSNINIANSIKLQTILMKKLFLNYGIIPILRAGELLGAYRNGGHLPWESSLDHWLIMPHNIEPKCFFQILKYISEKEIKNIEWSFQSYPHLYIFKSGVPEWFNHQGCYAGSFSHNHIKTDITVSPINFLFNPQFNDIFSKKYNIYPHKIISNLCMCSFNGAPAFAFDNFLKEYLILQYGQDFLTPRPGYKGPLIDPPYSPQVLDVQNLCWWTPSHLTMYNCMNNNNNYDKCSFNEYPNYIYRFMNCGQFVYIFISNYVHECTLAQYIKYSIICFIIIPIIIKLIIFIYLKSHPKINNIKCCNCIIYLIPLCWIFLLLTLRN